MSRYTQTRTRHKFNAIKVEHDGVKFDSKLEGRYYLYLKQLKAAGQIVQFLRQTPFHLPGKVTYKIDFLELWANGALVFTDVKGVETKEFIRNKKMVEDLYRPITINVVKKGDF